MSAIQRGSVVHHFHPELLLQSSMDKSEQEQASSSVSPTPTTTNLSLYQ